MERARSLDARPHLPEDFRNTVDGLLARDECWALNRDRVEAFHGDIAFGCAAGGANCTVAVEVSTDGTGSAFDEAR